MTHHLSGTIPDRQGIEQYRQTVKRSLNELVPAYERFTPGLGVRLRRKTLRLARALERSCRNTCGRDRRTYRH